MKRAKSKGKPKRTYIARVIVNGKRVPDFGLGPGVLLQSEVTFTDTRRRGWESPMFVAAVLDKEVQLKENAVRVEWELKKGKEK